MMKVLIGALAIAAMGGVAVAQERIESSDGEWFEVSCDDAGYLLTPLGAHYPEIYLRDNCVATNPNLGNGVWEWANGGTRIMIGPHRIGFPRQHPYCERRPQGVSAACRL